MIELKITGASAAEIVAEMQDLLCGAWLADEKARQSARGGVAIETAIRAAEKGAKVESVPAPMKEEMAAEQVAEAVTDADVRVAFGDAMARVGKEKVQALLHEYAPKLSEVDSSKYAELVERAKELV